MCVCVCVCVSLYLDMFHHLWITNPTKSTVASSHSIHPTYIISQTGSSPYCLFLCSLSLKVNGICSVSLFEESVFPHLGAILGKQPVFTGRMACTWPRGVWDFGRVFRASFVCGGRGSNGSGWGLFFALIFKSNLAWNWKKLYILWKQSDVIDTR